MSQIVKSPKITLYRKADYDTWMQLVERHLKKENIWTQADELRIDFKCFLTEFLSEIDPNYSYDPWFDHKGISFGNINIHLPNMFDPIEHDGKYLIYIHCEINGKDETCHLKVQNDFQEAFQKMLTLDISEPDSD